MHINSIIAGNFKGFNLYNNIIDRQSFSLMSVIIHIFCSF